MWLEIIIAWAVIGGALNITAITVFRRKGYFKWLGDLHDSNAYRKGYEDAKKEMNNTSPKHNNYPKTISPPQLREHGIEDNRYK